MRVKKIAGWRHGDARAMLEFGYRVEIGHGIFLIATGFALGGHFVKGGSTDSCRRAGKSRQKSSR